MAGFDRRRGRRCRRRGRAGASRTGASRSDIRWAWASIAATGSKGSREAVGGRRRGDELGDPLGACGRDGEGVEVRLGHQLGGEQRSGDVPAGRGAQQRRPEAGGTKDGRPPTRPDALRRRPGSGRPSSPAAEQGGGPAVVAVVPGLPGVALDEAEAARRSRPASRRRASGPRSSSVAQRCSEWPGGATQRGSGWAAKSAACSASERKPEMTIRAMPAARGRGGHPVEGGGDVGPHPLSLAVDERAAVAATAGHRRHASAGAGRGAAASATAEASTRGSVAAPRDPATTDGPDPHRGEGDGVGKADLQPRRRRRRSPSPPRAAATRARAR